VGLSRSLLKIKHTKDEHGALLDLENATNKNLLLHAV